ncbi:MAG: HD domain-containing protein [Deltaproteobacteria bacterium]|nr:HD domain-containing protein [Deltaproteobacteria bacterium]
MGKPLRVLSVEDSGDGTRLLIHELKRGGFIPVHERVQTAEALRAALREKPWDIVLCDDRLPELNCLDALALLAEARPDIPFIIVSETITDEMAVAAMRRGACDCITMDRRQRLVPVIERELRESAMRRAWAEAEKNLEKSREKLQKMMGATVQAMALAMETRDPYTAGHQRRVADLACSIAQEMGISSEEVYGIRMAGLIHDIGKISVPAETLSRPVRLPDVEINLIRIHPQVGFEILKDIEFPWAIGPIVLQHHERMDGSGYPQGLKGDEVCLEAKILAVADVVEAMSSHRPYRPGLGLESALDEIAANRGTLYEAVAVDACLRIFTAGYELPAH